MARLQLKPEMRPRFTIVCTETWMYPSEQLVRELVDRHDYNIILKDKLNLADYLGGCRRGGHRVPVSGPEGKLLSFLEITLDQACGLARTLRDGSAAVSWHNQQGWVMLTIRASKVKREIIFELFR